MVRKLRWPILVALLAIAAIAIILLQQQQPILQPIDPVIEPAEGGVYAEGLIGSLNRLNPLLDYYNVADRDVDRLLYSGLIRFDDRGLPQGDLADSWGISRDLTIYNFSIRENAVWHDGQPVTSDDIIFTIERMREDSAPLPEDIRQFWQQIEVRRLDEKTLQFRLPDPFAPFLDYLTFGVLPAHLLGDLTTAEIIDDPFNLQPVGSGPYIFQRLLVESGQITGLVLKANKEYYATPPYIEDITIRYYATSQDALQAYRNGDILGIGDIPLEILNEVLAEPELSLHTGRLPQLAIVFFNLSATDLPFFQDSAVRLALLKGLNRQGMIDRFLSGQGILADGPILPGTWAYYDGLERIEFDPEAAIEDLRLAGYTLPAEGGNVRTNTDGVALSFELIYVDDPLHGQLAENIRLSWERLGVMVSLAPLPYEQFTVALDSHQYQAALTDINLFRSPDPDPYPFWHQAQINGGQNYSGWDDRQASEYLEQARITVDLEERTRLYRNFQVRFARELPALPLFYPVFRYAVDAQVQGVSIGPLFDVSDRFDTITAWYLKTRRSDEGLPSPTSENIVTPTP
jgi:peptide/nickel transport system substrate-binding protein